MKKIIGFLVLSIFFLMMMPALASAVDNSVSLPVVPVEENFKNYLGAGYSGDGQWMVLGWHATFYNFGRFHLPGVGLGWVYDRPSGTQSSGNHDLALQFPVNLRLTGKDDPASCYLTASYSLLLGLDDWRWYLGFSFD